MNFLIGTFSTSNTGTHLLPGKNFCKYYATQFHSLSNHCCNDTTTNVIIIGNREHLAIR